MRFKGLDLNLLVALDALLAEQSVSGAAHKLNLSQPATSGALARLRVYFKDELLVPSGRSMLLTPLAQALAHPTRAALIQIETTVTSPPVFEPKTCDRTFTIACSDYVASVLIAPVCLELASAAPLMKISIMPHAQNVADPLERGDVDLVIVPDFYASHDHPAELLFEETQVVLGWALSQLMQGPIDRQAFFAADHVSVTVANGKEPAFAERLIRQEPDARKVAITVPGFIDVASFLIGTERVAIVHRRLAIKLSAYLPLLYQPAPFQFPPLREVIQIHRLRALDPALCWLQNHIRQAAART